MNTIKIIEFTAEYVDQVLDIIHETNCFHLNGDKENFVKIAKEDSRDYVEWILNDNDNFGFIAINSKDKVIGIILAGKKEKPVFYKVREVYYIYDIAVSNSCKGGGIGKKLIKKITEKAQINNIKQIDLEVFSFNEDAIAFYDKLGYQEVSINMSLNVKKAKNILANPIA